MPQMKIECLKLSHFFFFVSFIQPDEGLIFSYFKTEVFYGGKLLKLKIKSSSEDHVSFILVHFHTHTHTHIYIEHQVSIYIYI